MNSENKILPPMLIGIDEEISWVLKNDENASKIPPLLAADVVEGIRKINDSNCNFSAVYITRAIPKISALSLIHSVHAKRVGLPVFIFVDGKDDFFENEAEKLALHSVLYETITYSEMLQLTASRIENTGNSAAFVGLSETEENEFIPIKIEYFSSGLKSFFDLYIRLTTGKFIKLVSKGESFDIDRLQRYSRFGVTHFYLKKVEQKNYLQYCETLSFELLRTNSATTERQLTRSLHFGEQTLEFLKSTAIEKHQIARGVRFVENLRELTMKFSRKNEILAEFCGKFAAFDHGVSSAMLAYFMFKPLGIETKKTAEAIALACLLHDISLRNHSQLESKRFGALTTEEKEIFFAHPQESAKILSEISGINSITLRAVAQHHERRDGRGFPRKLKNGELLPIAEIVGITDEFSRLIQHSKGDDLEHKLQSEIFNGFSFNMISALCKIFFKKTLKTR